MSSIYDDFFARIPKKLLVDLSNGCTLGDKAYQQVIESDGSLLNSPYMYGLRSRIHDKAVQMYMHDRVENSGLARVYCKNTGFGNRVATICGDGYSLMPCHISERNTLPPSAKYKIKACENNPGNDYGQLNLFTPPCAESFSSVNFFVTTFFDGMVTEPSVILPDRDFSKILCSWSIPAVIATEMPKIEEVYQKRIMPKLLSEVQNEFKNNQGEL